MLPDAAGELLTDVSDIETQVKAATNATGSAPVFACRAWVNFDGTTTTPTIRASGNVSSVARLGLGDYEVNFSTAMPDANYAGSMNFDAFDLASALVRTLTTNKCTVTVVAPGVSFYNSSTVSAAFFR